MTDSESQSTRAWQIGVAIEAGVDEEEARRRINAGEIVATATGAALGGGAAATATGLGGVGLAFGGGAVGIGAAAAVAAPAVVAGAVGYGIFSGIRGLSRWNRSQTLRGLVEYFRTANQPHNVDRIFHIEGMGSLEEDRRPPTQSSTKATLRLLVGSNSLAFVTGLFCSPKGEFVLTYDLEESHWAYIRLTGENEFTGGGIDLRGQQLHLDDLVSVDLVLRILEREGFVNVRQEPFEEADTSDAGE